jgi:hypothetical protein
MATRRQGLEVVPDDDPEERLSHYDDAFLECRDLRHPWRVIGYYSQAGEARRTVECQRCGTQRVDRWSLDGRVRLAAYYRYAADYRIGEGITLAAVRHEVINRVTLFASEAEMIDATTPTRRRRRA